MQCSKAASKAASTATSFGRQAKKQIWILRHGQATHNPRAEAARENGCSYEEFMELMRQDDSLDSELTDLGTSQAEAVYEQTCKHLKEHVDLVVSSPLSRALQTADVAMPFIENRVCLEEFREINGFLLNAKRRPRLDLSARFPTWNFDHLVSDEDTWWKEALESQVECGERGYQGLCWIMERPEEAIFLVCHGGILRFAMTQHNLINMVDGRSVNGASRDLRARFGNCEIRRYIVQWSEDGTPGASGRRNLTLTEIDLV